MDTEPASWRHLWDELSERDRAAVVVAAREGRHHIDPDLARALEQAAERVTSRGLSLPVAADRIVVWTGSGDGGFDEAHVSMPFLEWVGIRHP